MRVREWENVGMLECLNVGMFEWGFRRFRRLRGKRYPFSNSNFELELLLVGVGEWNF